MSSKNNEEAKPGLHSRNIHRNGYDFSHLALKSPELEVFLHKNEHDKLTVDYANSDAVKALNKALLISDYGLTYWDIPDGYLCPPVPGRADYMHHLADLLASQNAKRIPTGPSIRVVDIGVGANAIYPIVGHKAYGWTFVGSEIDDTAIKSAQAIFENNESLKGALELRKQASSHDIFKGLMQQDEMFDLSVCNPPFHSASEDAVKQGKRKFNNLGNRNPEKSALNFGGRHHELWVEGGEAGFISRMIEQSRSVDRQCLWFTTLVSKKSNLPELYNMLDQVQAAQVKTVPMAQGLKNSRFIAWSFLNKEQHKVWTDYRWGHKK